MLRALDGLPINLHQICTLKGLEPEIINQIITRIVAHRIEFVDRKVPTVAGLKPPKPVLNLHWMGGFARGKDATEVELCEGGVVVVGG